MAAEFWTTWGNVRGPCGHAHKSYRTAEQCRQKDNREVKRVNMNDNTYSDRLVYRAENGRAFPADPGAGIQDRGGELKGRLLKDVYY